MQDSKYQQKSKFKPSTRAELLCSLCHEKPCTHSGGCNQDWISDGFCDDINNNLDCTYDGGDCCNQDWIADGYCDDNNNNLACTYDGGDCCGGIIDPNYCTECLCLEGGGSETTTGGSCNQGWIANGYCDDINNNLACTYDGGDCCGSDVNTQYCTECLCLEGGGGGSGGITTPSETTTGGSCNQGWIANGFCDDINNNLFCNYDGGDCCGSNVHTQYCTECLCLEGGGGGSGGNTTSSGTTLSGSCIQSWITDGYCDDTNNNLDCTYDGGDCCGSNVNTQYCTECLCLEGGGGGGSAGSTTPSGTTTDGSCIQVWIGDGYCEDINNNLACTYDGGDCCGPNVNTILCTDCQCLENQNTKNCPKDENKEPKYCIRYRVSHIEAYKVNWLLQIDNLRFSLLYL